MKESDILEMRKLLRKNPPSLTNRTDQEKNRIPQFEDKAEEQDTRDHRKRLNLWRDIGESISKGKEHIFKKEL